MAAVAWSNRRSSRNPKAQMLNRILSLTELQYQLVFLAEHIPGRLNTMADAGSRAWNSADLMWATWTNLSATWTQVDVLPPSTISPASGNDAVQTSLGSHYLVQIQFHMAPMGTVLPDDGSPWLTSSSWDCGTKLVYFAVYLWRYGWNSAKRGNPYSTIVSKIASVRWYHRRIQNADIPWTPQLRIRWMSNPVTKKYPVTPSFLRVLRHSITITNPRHRLLWGSLLLAYFFLLRRSEYLVVEKKRSSYSLKDAHGYFTARTGPRYRTRRQRQSQLDWRVQRTISMAVAHGERCMLRETGLSAQSEL
ncbi:LOW QUALITY PROTEIN: hypothetical protein PHMEG_00028247 [Phytophthora megakarya]|uniref:Uncharacterized protein n=1 Tax=Phytophthora megakarya TaxID=4795 RepID=A0A225V5Y9_9STRA|nr:LOW QUALITY PROTEIN: hypothetical protein PHMEG_00028247 [Phytophthora megakarya]